MKLNLKALFATAVTAFAFAPAAHANLLVDGSFEDPVVGSGTYTTLPNISGWVGGAAGIEVRNNVAGTAEDGSNFVELDTTGNSSISQQFATVAGLQYLVTYWVALRTDLSSQPADTSNLTLSLNVNGFAPTTITPAGTSWQELTYWFTAADASTAIEFLAAGTSDSYGASLDNVSVVQVPEPASLALLGLGLLGAAALRKRKQA